MDKNFYFVRHGETEHNAQQIYDDNTDIPLNSRGRQQAVMIRPVVQSLPIQTICVSPLQRAQETKELIAEGLNNPVVLVEELTECTGAIWRKMITLETAPELHREDAGLTKFMSRVRIGLDRALSHRGPVLIVAHGGVHWALCHHLGIKGHQRDIGNCVPVHFFQADNQWRAKVLYTF